jgi:NAD(P)-dependent dehydrogenase (short-subunit alcohol dehydrogenase family)
MQFDGLQDRVVVITGAAGNLGSACAALFRSAGARCVLIDQAQDPLNQTFSGWDDRHLLLGNVDLTREGGLDLVVPAIINKYGRIDALVHTVGTFRGGQATHTGDPGDWDLLLTLNLRTTVHAVRAFIPPMVAQRFGRAVVIGARAALHGVANVAAYGASKAAVLRLAESLAAEVKGAGVTVNAVLPATMDTPQNRAAMPHADFSKWTSPAQVAQVIAFLVSDAGRDITGAAIPVFGRE